MAHTPRTVDADDPFNEAVATTGLFLLVSAIIALAFALGSWSLSETVFAILSGAVAVLSFTASIFCFTSQAREPAPVEVSA
ncbi:hypothetical protein FK535_23995 [Mycolicibacterium sp. 018/SC-01/001]|uniref:hypothetical protein n=1 Tax=Mycolicibacterium sp. 018/SC-01/001 TaxID=2592069 RepID=UPI00118100AD|nr:hypothetical protein [Mycolicibacterium sp. 018/SC-01/001]TRW78859.1 hypothetical protein FK535_23995 [Mycolicibacterium sp. 018/SC-01/001]